MNYLINTPHCILADGYHALPSPADVTSDDRLFIVTNDASLKEALIVALNDTLSKRQKLSAQMFNEILDDTLTSLGQRNQQCDLAFLLMHSGGCLVAQMGRSRVLHISALNHEIAYDSRNQIQDYNTKARAEVLKDVGQGDVIIITLADRVDGHKLTQVVADHSQDEELMPQLERALSINRDEAPTSYMIHLTQVKGGLLSPLSDVNWKWITLFVALGALIVGVAHLSLNSNWTLPSFGSDNTEESIETPTEQLPADTIASDTQSAALEDPQSAAVPAPLNSERSKAQKADPEKPSSADEQSQNASDEPKSTEPTVDAPTSPEPQPVAPPPADPPTVEPTE